MNRLTAYPLVYVATPYTKYVDGRECAFKDASALAAKMFRDHGIRAYSPIAEGHPLATYGDLDVFDVKLWERFNAPMLELCPALVVAELRGWKDSAGVTEEIKYFKRVEKPVFYLDTVLMRVTSTPWEIE